MERKAVRCHHRHRADLVEVGAEAYFKLKSVCDESVVGYFKSGIAWSPVLAVPVVHSSSYFNYPPVGLGIVS